MSQACSGGSNRQATRRNAGALNDLNTEPMPEGRATPEAAQHTLVSEIDRWAPIIKAIGEYAD
jgi:hypothetical protein